MGREIKQSVRLNRSSVVVLVAGVLFFLLGAAFITVSFSLFWSASLLRNQQLRPMLPLLSGSAWRMSLSDFVHSTDSAEQRCDFGRK
jgi:hypothetical protein